MEALRDQTVVGRNAGAAEALLQHVELCQLGDGEILIEQDGTDNDIYFILVGSVRIVVNGREVATREQGEHVGEMALVDPGARRSATVVARGMVVVAKVSEPDFVRVADAHPGVWRALAIELGLRLRQRNRFHAEPNRRPVVFIGSSREALPVAMTVRKILAADRALEARLWSQGVFGASRFAIEDLEQQVSDADFAVLVGGPDDRVRSRGRERHAPRDNIIFELGLFMGSLARRRTFLLVPANVDLKIPTDLLGLTLLKYGRARSRREALLLPCADMVRAFRALGAR